MRRMLHGKRGISPLIATVILIGICVAGGLLIYNVFFSTAGVVTQRGQVEVETVDLIKSSVETTFSITIKNTGNKPVKILQVTLEDDEGEVDDDQEGPWNLQLGGDSIDEDNMLQPGQTASLSCNPTRIDDEEYVVGESYTVTIYAVFSDDSEFTDTIKVTCE